MKTPFSKIIKDGEGDGVDVFFLLPNPKHQGT